MNQRSADGHWHNPDCQASGVYRKRLEQDAPRLTPRTLCIFCRTSFNVIKTMLDLVAQIRALFQQSLEFKDDGRRYPMTHMNSRVYRVVNLPEGFAFTAVSDEYPRQAPLPGSHRSWKRKRRHSQARAERPEGLKTPKRRAFTTRENIVY